MTRLHLRHIDNEQDCLACFPVMRELRSHLTGPDAFSQQIRRQAEQGYHLLAAWQGEKAVALAGYRLQENLLYGRFLYIDDLVVSTTTRSQGVGQRLIEALRQEARQQKCQHLVLDTGLANVLAQRFYFRQGLLSKGLHFSEALQ